MQSLYVTVSGEKSIPTSHTVPEDGQSTGRTIKLTAQLHAGQKTHPGLSQVLQSVMGFLHI